MITLPTARSGRKREQQYLAFAAQLEELSGMVDFKMSARGWCYILEEHAGLLKSEFDTAESRINTCRKEGYLPLDFTATDDSRVHQGDTGISMDYPVDQELEWLWDHRIESHLEEYAPVKWVDYQPNYIEAMVEKIDLVNLFAPVLRTWHVPVSNGRGDTDINSKARMYRRFQDAADRGQQPVLLYCGDHDPKGLLISEYMRKQFHDLRFRSFEDGYELELDPDDLIIERIGLNEDQIDSLNLSKVPNLITGSGKDLGSPGHPDRVKRKPYIMNYLHDFGIWKVEANALVVRPEDGRQIMQEALDRYVSTQGRDEYLEAVKDAQEELLEAFPEYIQERLDKFGK